MSEIHKPLRVRAFIFDIDGTLSDTVGVCIEAIRLALLRFDGRYWCDYEIEAQFGVSEEGIFQRLLPDRWEQAMDSYIEAYSQLHPIISKPINGLREMLALLSKHSVPMGIVTGKGPRSAEVTLNALKYGRFFSHVELGSPNGSVKTERILKLAHEWRIPPEDIAYLGDTPYDVRASKAAGVTALAAAWASSTTADRVERIRAEHPDEVFYSVRDFRIWSEKHTDGLS